MITISGYLLLTIAAVVAFFLLVFGRKLGAVAALVIMVIVVGIVRYYPVGLFRAANDAENDMISDCATRCPQGKDTPGESTCGACGTITIGGETESQQQATSSGNIVAASSASATTNTNQQAPTQNQSPASCQTEWATQDPIRTWFDWRLPAKRPAGWLKDPDPSLAWIPSGVVCRTKMSDGSGNNTGENWLVTCVFADSTQAAAYPSYTMTVNGWIGEDSRLFQGEGNEKSTSVEVAGVGNWSDCPSCTATVCPTPVPAAATTSTTTTTSATNTENEFPFFFSPLPLGNGKDGCGCMNGTQYIECKNGQPDGNGSDWNLTDSPWGYCSATAP